MATSREQYAMLLMIADVPVVRRFIPRCVSGLLGDIIVLYVENSGLESIKATSLILLTIIFFFHDILRRTPISSYGIDRE